MKKNPILIALMVAAGGLLIWLLLKKPSTETTIVAPPANTGATGNDCVRVPENFPPFNTAVTPAGAKAYLGVTDAQFNDTFQARLLGFFVTLDVEPDEFKMKYFGKEAIIAYLNTPEGQLAHWQVVKGSRRCQSSNAVVTLR